MHGLDQILNHVLLHEKRTVPQGEVCSYRFYFALDSLHKIRYSSAARRPALSSQQSAKKTKTKAQLEAD
jgi:hypothetical protein